jgi:hypothetical protein
MRYAAEMGSGAMNIGPGIQKLLEDTKTHRQEAVRINLL